MSHEDATRAAAIRSLSLPRGPAAICGRGVSDLDASGTPCVLSRRPAVFLSRAGLFWAG